jgi:predicted ATPase
LTVAWNTAEKAFEASGVRLFIDAAKRADALFSLDVDDLEPLARILRMVGGTPLGIILSASWVDTLPVSEIADEIEKSMDFLEAGQTDHPERHRSVRAVFEYSWRLLDGEERRTFAGLSVFRGGFTREAAQAVAGASVRHLSNLVSKSLISFDRGSSRYNVHELLRQTPSDCGRARQILRRPRRSRSSEVVYGRRTASGLTPGRTGHRQHEACPSTGLQVW